MVTDFNRVAVIIAAWNAQSTVGRAVQSALAQPEVDEVVVVNDGSTDETALAALSAAAGDLRLAVISTEGNCGPAAARNIGIASSRANYIAVLDADDFFLPGRFTAMFAHGPWDAIADNIAFVREGDADAFDAAMIQEFEAAPVPLSLAQFISANIGRRGAQRGELGFAKPLMSRKFLADNGLRYPETLRLGEDFALYAKVLAAAGRFLTIRSCGYVAIERENSLSGQHRTADLAALLEFDREFEASSRLLPAERTALASHRRQLEDKVHHRTVLDIRARHGRGAALRRALLKPAALPRLALAVARDKFARPPVSEKAIRYLL